ncbi:MAG: 1-deoxy-D-xylulose-5-phosphate synthase [Prevotellaceae bacterium]|nr:1-deoxy-D-xylulose-5-phosphate synthase [Prevotellaceae bacterium]
MYLETINSPADVKKLAVAELEALCGEMRTALITKLSKHGGHCGPNLGIVEATVALHYVFSSPEDKIVWDVSHQSYPHKMLTGRREAFLDPGRYDEVSGYSETRESPHDHFVIGHTSTSVSLAAGLAKGRDLTGGKGNVIAVIGDGSLSGGEALEGLDFAGEMRSNLIIVVNDNQMSIAENHGGLYQNLEALRRTGGQCPLNLFKAMGLDYLYVAEGNDVGRLIEAFRSVKDTSHPTVVHINTLKGKGFEPAMRDKEAWHYCAPFDPEQVLKAMDAPKNESKPVPEDYAALTAEYLLSRMREDKRIVAITSGTPDPIGFPPVRRRRAGSQFVDVGIAEEHAVALASGIAKAGGKPVYGVLSTFLQRAYDQLSQDLCINRNPAVLLVYWGSLSSMNDVTHLCHFDIPLLSNIPNMVYLAPTSLEEHLAMLAWALRQGEHPVAIRVPFGKVRHSLEPVDSDYSELNRYKVVHSGSQVAVIGVGSFFRLGQEVCALLKEQSGVEATLINPRFISGVDGELLDSLQSDHQLVVSLEDGVSAGGFGEKIARHYSTTGMRVLVRGARKEFADRYDVSELLKANRLTRGQIVEDIVRLLGE